MPGLSSVRLAGRCDCSTSSILSAFSDEGYLMPRPPHPRSCFFEHTVFQGEVRHDLLEGCGLTTKVLHLAGRCGTCRIARQSTLAGFKELLGPAVIHAECPLALVLPALCPVRISVSSSLLATTMNPPSVKALNSSHRC